MEGQLPRALLTQPAQQNPKTLRHRLLLRT
jgi:hypothetical protein